MKLIALAAVLLAGGTAIAQEMPQSTTTTTTTTTIETTGTSGTGTVADEDPRGGYMPSGPALSGTPTPGAQIIFVPSASPGEAYPAPAPLKHYPLCKRGQFDNCRQRGG
jgi:hypothetical protein